ncbi:hypothetical protein [Vulcanisaeta sp. JCM 16159]|uniref:hypothetical protein n=1 Tax=Vulcanisaeta sp. JCM 16159 TaxID=1295371 RepID=UPI0006CF9045|nr:hypothetical protein [Vulcanisaeta sp. JCM 16159]
MPINKTLVYMTILLTLIITLIPPINALGSTYTGFYNIINWPVISVSIINGTYTSNGIVIVISPQELPNQQYYAFTGIGLIGNNYLLINGIIYANGTISIAEITAINASVSLSSNNEINTQSSYNITTYPSDYEVVGQRTYHIGKIVGKTATNTAMTGSNNSSAIYKGQTSNIQFSAIHGTNVEVSNNGIIIYIIINSSVIATISLIAMSMIMPLLKYRVHNDKECIDELFTKLVKKTGLKDLSLTIGTFVTT